MQLVHFNIFQMQMHQGIQSMCMGMYATVYIGIYRYMYAYNTHRSEVTKFD